MCVCVFGAVVSVAIKEREKKGTDGQIDYNSDCGSPSMDAGSASSINSRENGRERFTCPIAGIGTRGQLQQQQ